MNENYKTKVEATWEHRPVSTTFLRWQQELGGIVQQPKTVRLGDLIEQLEADGFDPKSINVQLTKDMLDLLVFPKSVSSTKEDDTSLEVTIAFSAITPTVEKESIHNPNEPATINFLKQEVPMLATTGDWVLKAPDGELFSLTTEDFDVMFSLSEA